MGLSVGGVGHAIIKLVSWVHVQLEVGAHRRLNRGVQALLQLLSHILVVIACAELLVKFFVLLGGVDSFNRHGCSGSSSLGLASLATI